MSEKIEINVADINLLSLNDQGEFFVKHFDECLNDPKYKESVKRWAKRIINDVNYPGSSIQQWNTSFPEQLLNDIVEIKSNIRLVTSEEHEMLKFLKKVDENASKNDHMSISDKDDYFKNVTWLYENGFLNGKNYEADGDEYYIFFLTSITEKGKAALKNESIY